MKKILFLSVIIGLTFAITTRAATISLGFPSDTWSVGDEISVPIILDTQGVSINTIDLGILYPRILRVKRISKSNSFLQLWVKEPAYTADAILLSGGLPGGINSQNAKVVTVVFEAAAVGDGAVGLSPASTVLLNDGSGTSTPLSLAHTMIHIIPRSSKQPPKVAPKTDDDKSRRDVVRPNAFSIDIGTDGRLFGGKYFISFFTTDSDTGVARYEIKEGDRPFALGRSPYLLSDQSLQSVIKVRAYDAAGNYRETAYPNWFVRFWWWITFHHNGG